MKKNIFPACNNNANTLIIIYLLIISYCFVVQNINQSFMLSLSSFWFFFLLFGCRYLIYIGFDDKGINIEALKYNYI